MNSTTAQILVRNAVRWAQNIMVELLSNYGEKLPDAQHTQLRAIVIALADYEAAFPSS